MVLSHRRHQIYAERARAWCITEIRRWRQREFKVWNAATAAWLAKSAATRGEMPKMPALPLTHATFMNWLNDDLMLGDITAGEHKPVTLTQAGAWMRRLGFSGAHTVRLPLRHTCFTAPASHATPLRSRVSSLDPILLVLVQPTSTTFFDSHDDPENVKYRDETFLPQIREYQKFMYLYKEGTDKLADDYRGIVDNDQGGFLSKSVADKFDKFDKRTWSILQFSHDEAVYFSDAAVQTRQHHPATGTSAPIPKVSAMPVSVRVRCPSCNAAPPPPQPSPHRRPARTQVCPSWCPLSRLQHARRAAAWLCCLWPPLLSPSLSASACSTW